MGARQMVKRTGVYRRCDGWQGCGGKGWVPGPGGKPMTHVRCRGDGWIRVGSAPGGRGRPRGRSGGVVRKVKRAAVSAGTAGVLGWWVAGTVGLVVVAVLAVLVVGLRVHRKLAGAGW